MKTTTSLWFEDNLRTCKSRNKLTYSLKNHRNKRYNSAFFHAGPNDGRKYYKKPLNNNFGLRFLSLSTTLYHKIFYIYFKKTCRLISIRSTREKKTPTVWKFCSELTLHQIPFCELCTEPFRKS